MKYDCVVVPAGERNNRYSEKISFSVECHLIIVTLPQSSKTGDVKEFICKLLASSRSVDKVAVFKSETAAQEHAQKRQRRAAPQTTVPVLGLVPTKSNAEQEKWHFFSTVNE